jgi:Protein of unknown function (DUF3147)
MKGTQTRTLIDDDEKPVAFDLKKLGKSKPGDYAVRFAFGAAIAVVAAVISMAFGQKVGGLFLAFPAILPATLTLLEKKEGKTKACADASGGVLGALGLAAFAAVALLLLRRTAPVLALGLALLAWTVVAVGLYFIFRATDLYEKEDQLLQKRD